MTPLKSSTWLETLFLGIGYLERYLVAGDSMTPTLSPGDEVAVDHRGTVVEGDIVVMRHPFKTDIVVIKRLDHIEDSGEFYLLSDNPVGSSDSRGFGAVPRKHFLGKAVARICND
ncbi:MAG: nickel-type superoxide dismutase maturation protease [Pyrinomonadaceae bacterium]